MVPPTLGVVLFCPASGALARKDLAASVAAATFHSVNRWPNRRRAHNPQSERPGTAAPHGALAHCGPGPPASTAGAQSAPTVPGYCCAAVRPCPLVFGPEPLWPWSGPAAQAGQTGGSSLFSRTEGVRNLRSSSDPAHQRQQFGQGVTHSLMSWYILRVTPTPRSQERCPLRLRRVNSGNPEGLAHGTCRSFCESPLQRINPQLLDEVGGSPPWTCATPIEQPIAASWRLDSRRPGALAIHKALHRQSDGGKEPPSRR